MGNSTFNYGLFKPSDEDYYNVEDFNRNSDIVDLELKGNSDRTSVLEENLYNPNLLINSNFRVSELVNQRGNSTYHGGWGYFVDMLECYAGHDGHYVSLENEYLRLINVDGTYTCTRKKIEKLKAGVVTFSAKVKGTAGEFVTLYINDSNGVRVQQKWFVCSGEWETLFITGELVEDDAQAQVMVWFSKANGNGILDISYMKLEYGSVATRFVDDDMATKLLKCQRYLQIIDKNSNDGFLHAMIWTDYINFPVSFSEMRSNPSITKVIEPVVYAPSIISGFVFSVNSISKKMCILRATKTAHNITTTNMPIVLFSASNASFILSAEL